MPSQVMIIRINIVWQRNLLDPSQVLFIFIQMFCSSNLKTNFPFCYDVHQRAEHGNHSEGRKRETNIFFRCELDMVICRLDLRSDIFVSIQHQGLRDLDTVSSGVETKINTRLKDASQNKGSEKRFEMSTNCIIVFLLRKRKTKQKRFEMSKFVKTNTNLQTLIVRQIVQVHFPFILALSILEGW